MMNRDFKVEPGRLDNAISPITILMNTVRIRL